MGTITSGTGLISGLDIESLVSQLMSIESNVKTQVEGRLEVLVNKQTALTGLQARVLAIQLAAANFNKENIFQQKTFTSSNEDILTVTGTRFASLGNYKFRVKQLATSYHAVSGSYSSLNSSIGTGNVTFEMGNGQLASDTNLDFLNGQQGFSRGTIKITDRAGNSAEIDLNDALTIQDVLDKINGNSDIQVTASVSADHLVITDNSGGSGNLIVADVGGGSAALELGIRTFVAGDTINGSDVNYITTETLLKDLNDGNGVRGLGGSSVLTEDLVFSWDDGATFGVALSAKMAKGSTAAQSTTLQSLNGGEGVRLGTIRITDQNGTFVDIDLTELGENATAGQLEEFIEQKAFDAGMRKDDGSGGEVCSINVAFHGLDHLTITDSSDPSGYEEDGERTSHFIIEDLNGGHAASDLGIADDVNSDTITGEQVWFMETLGDVMNAVNNHWANNDGLGNRLMELAINEDGTGLKVVDLGTDPFAGGLTVSAGTTLEQWAGEDLGILATESDFVNGSYSGRRLIAGLNTTLLRSLNGGNSRDTIEAGVITYGENHIVDPALETLTLTDSDSNSVNVDLSHIDTVQDLIDAINNAGTGIKAGLNSVGNGMVLTDESTGTGAMAVSGTLAEKLGLVVNPADGATEVNSGNLQLQYISESMLLEDMRQGQGIERGAFIITDSNGRKFTVDLAKDSIQSLGDVVDAINSVSAGGSGGTFSNIQARINDTGDGIVLEDSGGSFTVEESGGQTANDLRILGTAVEQEDGTYAIDGSYELHLEVGGGDTIEDIVAMINDADVGIQASVINVGSTNNPSYRISFNSEVSGRVGRIYIDAGQTNLSTQTLAEGDDAIVLFGEGGAGQSLLISSSSNTIDNVVKGVTLELKDTSDTPVSVNVDQDLDGIIEQIKSFVTAYNETMKTIAELTSFNADTEERGILFADHTVRSIEYGLESIMTRTYTSSTINRLSQIGLKFGSLGSETSTENGQTVTYAVAGTLQIEFNETTFREAFAKDPDTVTSFFTQVETGFGDYIAEQLDNLAGTSESTTSYRIDAMETQRNVFEDRIEYLKERLATKEESLYKQFYAMEEALASLQTQQSAISQLSLLATS